jgi:hypothetical protein
MRVPKVHSILNHYIHMISSRLMKSTFFLRFFLLATWLAIFSAVFAALPHISRALAQTTIPPTWDVLSDDFESGTLDQWQLSSPFNPVLAPGAGYNGTTGLSVAVRSDSSYNYQTDVAKAEEDYLTFGFNPNRVSIPDESNSWIPGKSLSIAEVNNSTQLGIDYFVDGVNGSDSNPGTPRDHAWRTIQKAVDSVNPGDTIYVLAGVYSENVKFNRSGNADNPILLTYYGQDVVIINGSGSPAIEDVFGTQYWIIDGLTIESQAQETIRLDAWGCDGTCGGTHHWIIRNNKIIGPILIYGSYNTFEGNEVDGSSNNGNGNGVWEYYDVSHHNTYRNNYIHNFSTRGIWSMHRTHDSIFEGNIVNNIGTTSGDCIDLDGHGTVEWRHLIINNKLSQCGASGLKLENTFDSIVKNNIIHNIGLEAIVFINSQECQVGGENNQYGNNNDCRGKLTANKVLQNLIYRSGEIGSIRVLYTGGVEILGNMIAYGTGKGIWIEETSPQISIRNNIFAKNSNSQIILWTTNPLASDDHNLFFVSDPEWVYEVNNSHYSLPKYQSLTHMGNGSLLGNPQFIDPNNNNFHPKESSPSVDAGVNIDIPEDIDGNPRPQRDGYDIGPYELPSYNFNLYLPVTQRNK